MVKQLAENGVKTFRISLLPNSVDFVIKAYRRGVGRRGRLLRLLVKLSPCAEAVCHSWPLDAVSIHGLRFGLALQRGLVGGRERGAPR
jgi:hypothetical protein